MEKTENNETAVELQNVSKKFKIGFNKREKIFKKILSLISGIESKKEFLALDNISFNVKKGEKIGIIGKNGAGKSTLLRVIAGIYPRDKGSLKTSGRMIYMSGFGIGLRPRLTMKENIYLIGSVMGLGQKDIKENFDKIVEFSELRDYIDTKVYQFSDGMITRLNFSIGVHCLKHLNPDILLLDEVLGVGGDTNFQEKALEKMKELFEGDCTILLVSHDLKSIEKYCKKVIWMEKGEIKKVDSPENIINLYKESKKTLRD